MNIMDSDKSRVIFGRLPFAWQTLLGARTVSAVALDTRSCPRSQRTNLPGRCENYSISSFLRSYAENSSTNYPQDEWRNTRVNRVLNIACGLAILSTNPIEKTSRKSNLPSDRLSRTYHGLNLRPMFQVTCEPISIVARVFFGCSCHTTTDPVTVNPCTMSTLASMPAETYMACGTPSTGRHPTAVEVQIYFIVRDLRRHVRCYVCLAGGSKCHSNPKREFWADAEHSSNLECRYRYGIHSYAVEDCKNKICFIPDDALSCFCVAYVIVRIILCDDGHSEMLSSYSPSLLQVIPTASVEHSALVLKLLSPRMTVGNIIPAFDAAAAENWRPVMGYSVRVSAVEAMVRGRVTEILICDAILAVVLDISTPSMAPGAYATEAE
ncbi:uncharacterized protein BO96DRAFT_467804 [Aspergillus niger CBS 101883]|uniref:uncharacterized protein n=1 Tax=Aspergillus lacticoffeatus (strain CBS 101883) TaxID=1450533 RepID=UPI000D7F1510|nr:uncharacterized protein BO96DRAFT_467804 [Aspergillus niger CBS 101883]PYH54571.1 hypothetical protein BO96DRAFT_467804 [Aspergillus niger CBS 101883]